MTWLAVRDGKVRVAMNTRPDPEGLGGTHDVFEWFGSYEVYAEEILAPDGTVSQPAQAGLDPRPVDYDTGRDKLDELAAAIADELAWLDDNIPLIGTMNAAQVRAVVGRLARENRQILRGMRYLANKVGDN